MGKGWTVNHNDHGEEMGLDPGYLETFKRDPISSFAREIVQNSIDAKRDDKDKVIVEFKTFSLNKNEIPDYETLVSAFKESLEYLGSKNKKIKNHLRRLKEMNKLINQDKIISMRVSDFNTTGLLGVNTNEETSNFYALTKGQGVSYKVGTAGGSKGIGKYASFVISKLHTIFYSTKTINKEKGFMGRAILPSGYYIDPKTGKRDENGLLTNGLWYYSNTFKKLAINGELSLDHNHSRTDSDTGTDLYIIGFDEEKNWQQTMIVKILESFAVSIIKGRLEVEVDDIIINKDTIKEIIDSLNISKRSVDYRVIRSQYDLLTSKDTYRVPINIENYGTVDLYVKSYSKYDSNLASKRCVISRYPYMKIKDLTSISQIPFSALAIINNDKVNEVLRSFENPEHTGWFFRRNDKTEEESKIARKIYNKMVGQIKENIIDYLFTSDKEETDVVGASDFLPQENVIGEPSSETKIKVETIKIHKPKQRKNIDDIGYTESDFPDAYNPNLGAVEEDGDPYTNPGESNNNGGGGETNIDEGDEFEHLKKEKLQGIRYRLVSIEPDLGEYVIRFSHNEKLENCDLKLEILGDSYSSREKHDLVILKASSNSTNLKIEKNKILGFNISKNNINDIYLKTDQTEIFSGRVTIYAPR